MGQTETRAHRRGMSVLPPGADMSMTGRFAPKNETARAVGAAAWGAGVPAMDGRWERVA